MTLDLKYTYRTLSRTGRRLCNEDALYPCGEDIPEVHGLFMACDGVGGAPGGEVASKMACELIARHLDKHLPSHEGIEVIRQSVQSARMQMTTYTITKPHLFRMCTTLTLVYYYNAQVVIAWIGDSRIYHIRDGTILFKSKDHSQVQEWVDVGVLRPEEAITHPMKNVVTRVLGPNHKNVEPEVLTITELRPGDQFVLCTDGILDGLAEPALLGILSSEKNIDEKISAVDAHCKAWSNDNYSMVLIELTGGKHRI